MQTPEIRYDLELKTFLNATIHQDDALSDKRKQSMVRKTLKGAASLYLLEKIRRQNHSLFVGVGHHKNTRGEPLTFSNNRFLWQIYNDTSKHLIFRKCVQVGISELLVIRAIERATDGGTVLYVLPTAGILNTFVSERFDPLLLSIPYYQNLITTGVDNKHLKQFGMGSIVFTGAGAKGSKESQHFSSVPATDLILDEYDRMALAVGEDNLQSAYSRLESAKDGGRIIECANPRGVDVMIDAKFKSSSQNFWLVPCEHCGHWQYPDWYKGIVRQVTDLRFELRDTKWSEMSGNDIQYICEKCDQPLDLFTDKALWAARFPKHEKHGYSINKLMFAYTRRSRMWETFQKSLGNPTLMRIFYGDYLGLGYQDASSTIEESHVLSCRDEDYTMPDASQTTTIAGIDVHKVFLHVTIFKPVGNKLVAVAIRRVRTEQEIKQLLLRYSVAVACFDSMPETRMIRRLKDDPQLRHIIYDTIFSDTKGQKFKIDKVKRSVNIERTEAIDEVFTNLIGRRLVFPYNIKSVEGGVYVSELASSVRIEDKWLTKHGHEDHFLLSTAYAMLAESVLRSIYTLTSLTEMTEEQADDAFDTSPIDLPLFGVTTKQEVIHLVKHGYLPEVHDETKWNHVKSILMSVYYGELKDRTEADKTVIRESIEFHDEKFNVSPARRHCFS